MIFALAASVAACAPTRQTGNWTPPARYTQDLASCSRELDALGVDHQPWRPQTSNFRCAVRDGVQVRRLGVALSPPTGMRCGVALAIADWSVDVERAAQRHLGVGVEAIENWGAWSCRRMRGGRRWSEHASANAFDVNGFRLEDGRRVDVLRDWGRGAEGRFLREATLAACDRFGVVLSPDSDAAHADHLHLDLGPWRSCGVDG